MGICASSPKRREYNQQGGAQQQANYRNPHQEYQNQAQQPQPQANHSQPMKTQCNSIQQKNQQQQQNYLSQPPIEKCDNGLSSNSYQQNLQQIQIIPIEKKENQNSACFNCKDERETLISLECGHLYHKKCLIEIFKTKNLCLCGRKVVSIKALLGPQTEEIIMKNRLSVIFKDYQMEKQFYQCTDCPYFFAYNYDLNKSFSQEHFCPICLKMKPYDQMLCQMIDQERNKIMDSVNLQKQPKKLQQCYSCNKELQENDLIKLSCSHLYHFECLKNQVQNSCKYKCICGKKIKDQNLQLKDNELQDFKNQLFDLQLSKIINYSKKTFDFCKDRCAFFWISEQQYENQQNNINNCNQCNEQLCFECNKKIFRQSITFQSCNHLHHITCALKKIQSNNNILPCKCKIKLALADLEQLGIVCMICNQQSSCELFKFKCQHYIHKECFEQNFFQFINLECCGESLLEVLEIPELKEVKKKLYQNKNERFCSQCGDGTNKDHLLGLECRHFIHQKCFEELVNTTYFEYGSIQCQCKMPISDDFIMKLF